MDEVPEYRSIIRYPARTDANGRVTGVEEFTWIDGSVTWAVYEITNPVVNDTRFRLIGKFDHMPTGAEIDTLP